MHHVVLKTSLDGWLSNIHVYAFSMIFVVNNYEYVRSVLSLTEQLPDIFFSMQ